VNLTKQSINIWRLMNTECQHDRRCWKIDPMFDDWDCEHLRSCYIGEGDVNVTYERYHNSVKAEDVKDDENSHWWGEDSGWPPDKRLAEFFGIQSRNGNYARPTREILRTQPKGHKL